MDLSHQKLPVTPAAIEQAFEHLLPRLPYWALRNARQRLGSACDPWRCALAVLLRASLQVDCDCSNLLGLYPDGIWLQGESRPLKVPPPAWASALIHGLDHGRHPGDPITGTDILVQLQHQGLLVMSNGELWGQGALATALLRDFSPLK